MNDSAWKREVDEFLAKTTQPKPLLSLITVPPPSQPQPVPLLSLRPRFIPPLLQSPQQTIIPRQPRPRQPVSVVQKRPSAPTVIRPSKPIEQTPPPPPPPPAPIQSSKISKEQQDEDELLQLNEPTDIVDTFALIDEALLDDDSFLELM
jgi:hypothetical protein